MARDDAIIYDSGENRKGSVHYGFQDGSRVKDSSIG